MRPNLLPKLCLWIAACCLGLPAGAPGQPAVTQPPAPRLLSIAPGAQRQAFADGAVQFIGAAAVLLRCQGLTVLTDPNFLHEGRHARLGYGLRAQRLTNPALELAQLPPIDLVVLSQFHEDHFDRETQRRLHGGAPIVTTHEAAAEDFEQEIRAAGLEKKIIYLRHGETYSCDAARR